MATAHLGAIDTQLWKGIGMIADDESLMKRLAK